MDLFYRNPHYYHLGHASQQRNPTSHTYVLTNPEKIQQPAPYYQVQQQEQLGKLLREELEKQLQREQANKQELQQQLRAREQMKRQLQRQQQQQPQQQQLTAQEHQQGPHALSPNYFDVVEQAGRFLMYTDLPGCKVQDVKVALLPTGVLEIEGERKRGKHPKKFIRKFAVDDRLVDPSKITATLSEGSLEISAPKKQVSGPRKIPVMSASPPEADEQRQPMFHLEVDLPGVGAENVAVILREDKIYVLGQRHRGGQVKKFQQAFPVESHSAETSKMLAYLEDGVLSICAPAKEPIVPRLVPINGKLTEAEVHPLTKEAPEPPREQEYPAPNRIPIEVLMQLLRGPAPPQEVESKPKIPEEPAKAQKEVLAEGVPLKGTPSDPLQAALRNAVEAVEQKGDNDDGDMDPFVQGALKALQEAILEKAADEAKKEAADIAEYQKQKVLKESEDKDDNSVPPLEDAENTTKEESPPTPKASNNRRTGNTITLHRLTPAELMAMFPGLFQQEQGELSEEATTDTDEGYKEDDEGNASVEPPVHDKNERPPAVPEMPDYKHEHPPTVPETSDSHEMTPMETMMMMPLKIMKEVENEKHKGKNEASSMEMSNAATMGDSSVVSASDTLSTKVDAVTNATVAGESDVTSLDAPLDGTIEDKAGVTPGISYADMVKNDPAVEDYAPIDSRQTEAEGANGNAGSIKPSSSPGRTSPERDDYEVIVPETVSEEDED